MAKNITRHVQHIKSVDTTTITVDGQDVIVAKLPEWGDLKDGEIAVNYKDGYETISIRNNNNEVVAFPNINTVNTLIDKKAQKLLTFDSTPTANSVNPVTSDGIKTYVDAGDSIQSLTTYQSSTPLAVGDTHDQAFSKLSKIIDDNEIVTARALTDLNDTKQDEIEDLDVIRAGAALGATALQTETQLSKGTTTGSGNAVTDISVDNHQITLTKGATFLTEHQDLSAYADGAEYDSVNHLIYLKHGNTRLANPINAADFIKDGMVNSVRIGVLDDSSDDETRYLIVTFNTDAGLKDIEIPLTDIFDPSLYYTKEEINEHELVTAAALTELHDTKADKVALNDLNTNKQDKLEFDDEPTEDSSNPVTSDGIKTYVDNANKITTLEEPTVSTPLAVGDTYDTAFGKLTKIIRDNEFTTAGALTELHNTKQELLTFDSTPTANSQNPVTSEGIKEYVDDAIDASTPMTEITYSDLVTARNNNNLKPGTWYRITDYTTTTTQKNTQSAGHNFDIIVLATSSNTLSEEARAIKHDGDTYFANSNLNAWKVWYCLDNDKSRFAWADDSVDESTEESIDVSGYYSGIFIRNSQLDMATEYCWTKTEGSHTYNIYTSSPTPTSGDKYATSPNERPAKTDIINSYTPAYEGTNLPNGRGVIYRLVDEFNNDIKYDFKNIQFKRTITDGQYDKKGTDTWCYTLNLWYNNMCQDASIVGNTLLNDEGFVTGVYDNKFGCATAYDLNIEGVNTFAFALGNNVILSFDDSAYYGIHSNTIKNSCYSNTIGDNFVYNTILSNFNHNTIGNHFYSNKIGNDFFDNTIGNDFYGNIIGNSCNSNTIGSSVNSNTFGNGFNSKTVSDNTIYKNYGNNGVELATKDDIGNIETALNNI